MFKQGQRVQLPETLAQIRERTSASVESLASETRQLDSPTPLKVEISEELQQLTSKVKSH